MVALSKALALTSDARPLRWQALTLIMTPGAGSWTCPADGYYRISAQGPGGAGRRAPHNQLGGPGGGAGGRARKVNKYSKGDVINFSIGQGGQTEGANGTAATTWNAGELTANPGSGGASGLTGTSYNQGGGAGGAATGGDENITGGTGGNTASAQGSTQDYGTAASGGGAPFDAAQGMWAPAVAFNGTQSTTTAEFALQRNRQSQRGGGRGGFYATTSIGPNDGARGGGGGGGSGRALYDAATAKYFGKGGDGEILIEQQSSLLSAYAGMEFPGYRSGMTQNNVPSGAALGNSQTLMNARFFSPLRLDDDVLIGDLGAYAGAISPGDGFKLAIHDGISRQKMAETAAMTSDGNGINWGRVNTFAKRGLYILELWVNSASNYSFWSFGGNSPEGITTSVPIANEFQQLFGDYDFSQSGPGNDGFHRYFRIVDSSTPYNSGNPVPSTVPNTGNVARYGYPVIFWRTP